MKNVLITGADSYIGLSFEQWLLKEQDKYSVITLDLRDDLWKEKDFSKYDAIFHVAGIAHIKETTENRELYYKVNRDLAFETAKKAKAERVKHFIFLSSMSVYGMVKGTIDKYTAAAPNTAYGKSKLEAEELIKNIESDSFTVTILRPPMVYGKGCKGNYPRLAGLALKSPIFPNVENKRSMIYIDNLCEFIKRVTDNKDSGLFLPQNAEYVNTAQMVSLIAKAHGKSIKLTKIFNPILRIMNISTVNKVFGNLYYESDIADKISLMSFHETISKTEL